MKKSIIFISVLAMLLSFTTIAYAYETDDYSIDVPDNYTEIGTCIFQRDDGNNFNINITNSDKPTADVYTEENLDAFVEMLEKDMENYKAEIEANVREQYAGAFTEEQIKEYIDSFKVESVLTKEITTCTPKEYKCFHVTAVYSMGDYTSFSETYSIVSGSKVITLTFTSLDQSYFTSQEKEDILNSFTIKNYEAPKTSTIWQRLLSKGIYYFVLAVVGACVGGATAAKKKKQKKAEESVITPSENTDYTYTVDEWKNE